MVIAGFRKELRILKRRGIDQRNVRTAEDLRSIWKRIWSSISIWVNNVKDPNRLPLSSGLLSSHTKISIHNLTCFQHTNSQLWSCKALLQAYETHFASCIQPPSLKILMSRSSKLRMSCSLATCERKQHSELRFWLPKVWLKLWNSGRKS